MLDDDGVLRWDPKVPRGAGSRNSSNGAPGTGAGKTLPPAVAMLEDAYELVMEAHLRTGCAGSDATFRFLTETMNLAKIPRCLVREVCRLCKANRAARKVQAPSAEYVALLDGRQSIFCAKYLGGSGMAAAVTPRHDAESRPEGMPLSTFATPGDSPTLAASRSPAAQPRTTPDGVDAAARRRSPGSRGQHRESPPPAAPSRMAAPSSARSAMFMLDAGAGSPKDAARHVDVRGQLQRRRACLDGDATAMVSDADDAVAPPTPSKRMRLETPVAAPAYAAHQRLPLPHQQPLAWVPAGPWPPASLGSMWPQQAGPFWAMPQHPSTSHPLASAVRVPQHLPAVSAVTAAMSLPPAAQWTAQAAPSGLVCRAPGGSSGDLAALALKHEALQAVSAAPSAPAGVRAAPCPSTAKTRMPTDDVRTAEALLRLSRAQ